MIETGKSVVAPIRSLTIRIIRLTSPDAILACRWWGEDLPRPTTGYACSQESSCMEGTILATLFPLPTYSGRSP